MITKTPPAFDSWQVALPRRVMTLARMGPLHRFEATKATRTLNLKAHDLRTLGLMVFDAVIERMGLAAGASHDEIVEALKPLILAAEPEADASRVLEITDGVLDFLLNEADRRRAFREEVRLYEDGTQAVREVAFHYVQQLLGPDDEPLFRATVEGINLYTGTLGLDVEDAHAANAAVLKYQIGRGRFREAVATARQAVAISTAYEQKVRRALDIARRDVTQVNWVDEVLATLDEAREHLRTRIDADNEILAAVEDHGEEAEPDERIHVADLEKHIHACQSRHSALHVLVMDANESWLGEHARQAFRPRALGVLPDLEASVLRRSLTLIESQLDDVTTWGLTGAFLPPWPPHLADGRRLAEMLLAPPREQEGGDSSQIEPDAEELTQAPDRFTEHDYRHAEELLSTIPERGAHLSTMLTDARARGFDETTQTLLYLLALRDYGEAEENVEYVIGTAARCFIAEPYWGDDLMVSPPAKFADETA